MRKVNFIFFLVFFIILFIISVNSGSTAPRVMFNSTVYKVNENVSGTLTKKAEGIYNEIINSSQGPQLITFDLGKTEKPGFYRVDFKFSKDDFETYFVFIYPNDVDPSSLISIIPVKIIKISYLKFIEAIMKFRNDKRSFAPILTSALKEYFKTHAIDIPVGITACIAVPVTAAGAPLLSPVLAAQCSSYEFETSKGLLIQFLYELNEGLFTYGYLNSSDYQLFKANIKSLDFITGFVLGDNILDKLLAVCSLSEEDDQKKLVMGANFGNQFYKKYQFILKLK